LQDLNLSYSPGISTWKKIPFKSLQLYIDGRNLGILWRANKTGTDPDYPGQNLPPSYNLSFGVKGTFQ